LGIVWRRRPSHTGAEGAAYANRPGHDRHNDPVHRFRDLDLRAGRRLFALVTATGSTVVAGTTGEFAALEVAGRLALVHPAADGAEP